MEVKAALAQSPSSSPFFMFSSPLFLFLLFFPLRLSVPALQELQETDADPGGAGPNTIVFFSLCYSPLLLSTLLLLPFLPIERPVCACVAGVARGRWRSRRRWGRHARARRPSLPRIGRNASSSSKLKRYTSSLMLVLFLFLQAAQSWRGMHHHACLYSFCSSLRLKQLKAEAVHTITNVCTLSLLSSV